MLHFPSMSGGSHRFPKKKPPAPDPWPAQPRKGRSPGALLVAKGSEGAVLVGHPIHGAVTLVVRPPKRPRVVRNARDPGSSIFPSWWLGDSMDKFWWHLGSVSSYRMTSQQGLLVTPQVNWPKETLRMGSHSKNKENNTFIVAGLLWKLVSLWLLAPILWLLFPITN